VTFTLLDDSVIWYRFGLFADEILHYVVLFL
jgi:hypothetical protein